MNRASMRLLVAAVVVICLAAGQAVAGMPAAKAYPGPCGKPSWVAAWALPVSGTSDELNDQTLRVILAPNFGGDQVSVRLSNALGEQPVTFENAAVGLVDSGAALRPDSTRPLTFGGATRVSVGPGDSVVSDPVALPVRPFEELAVSVYAAEPTGPATGHTPLPGGAGNARSYLSSGDHTLNESAEVFGSSTLGSRFVTAVDVFAPNDGVLAIIGDSITEGATWASEPYSTRLARRLHQAQADGGPRLSVVNLGISGNALMSDYAGPSAVKRLDRDVLSQSGLAGVVLMEGINDLAVISKVLSRVPLVEDFANAYTEVDKRVRDAGAELFVSPLTPAGDLFRPTIHSTTPEQIERRHEVNQWIRTSDVYDRRLDFDAAIRYALEPNWIDPRYNTADNIHPNDDGHQRMVDSVDPSLFDRFRCGPPVS